MFNKVNDEQECGFFSKCCAMFGVGGSSTTIPEPEPVALNAKRRFNLMLFNRCFVTDSTPSVNVGSVRAYNTMPFNRR